MIQSIKLAGARTRTGEDALPGAWQLGMARGGVEVKTFFRDKMAVAFIFGLPPILLVLLGSIFGSQAAAQGVTVGQLFTAGMIAGGLMSTSFQYLAITIATERENGMLKRLFGTPMPRPAYFAGKVGQRDPGDHAPVHRAELHLRGIRAVHRRSRVDAGHRVVLPAEVDGPGNALGVPARTGGRA
jgi:hypothetical protein